MLSCRSPGEDDAMCKTEDEVTFDCADCGVDTSAIDEYYMVIDAVWLQTGLTKTCGMLCIGCLETRLGRRLVPADFLDAPINQGFFTLSERIHDRMNTPISIEQE